MSSMLALHPGIGYTREGSETQKITKDSNELPYVAYKRELPANNANILNAQITSNQHDSSSSAEVEVKSYSNSKRYAQAPYRSAVPDFYPDTEMPPVRSSNSYIITRVGNLESDVDHWIQGNSDDNCDGIRQEMYYLGMLSSNDDRPVWRGPTASVMMMLTYIALVTNYIKNAVSWLSAYLAQLSIEQLFRDCAAAGMDIVMAMQTFMFLALSVYLSGVQFY